MNARPLGLCAAHAVRAREQKWPEDERRFLFIGMIALGAVVAVALIIQRIRG
jgi:hypothetical protein